MSKHMFRLSGVAKLFLVLLVCFSAFAQQNRDFKIQVMFPNRTIEWVTIPTLFVETSGTVPVVNLSLDCPGSQRLTWVNSTLTCADTAGGGSLSNWGDFPGTDGLEFDLTNWSVTRLNIPRFRVTNGDPTGSCSTGLDIATNIVDGSFWHCVNSIWAKVTSVGGGSGSVTAKYDGSLDYPAGLCDGCVSQLGYTATGVAAGATLAYGIPSALPANVFAMPIASADTVYWRVLNAGPPVDIAPLTFSVRDLSAIGYAKVSAVLSIPEMCDGCVASLSLPFVGAVAGDRVAPGWPSDLPSTLMGEMVAGAGEIVIKLLNAGIRIAGSNHTFSASITK